MKKTQTPNLDRLTELSAKLHQLTADPHPGLHTWVVMLGSILDQIAEFAPKDGNGERDAPQSAIAGLANNTGKPREYDGIAL